MIFNDITKGQYGKVTGGMAFGIGIKIDSAAK